MLCWSFEYKRCENLNLKLKNDITFTVGWVPSKAKAKARPWCSHFIGDMVPGSKSEDEQAEWDRKRESSLIQVCVAEVSATGAGAQFQEDLLRNIQNPFQLFTCSPVGGRLEHPSVPAPPPGSSKELTCQSPWQLNAPSKKHKDTQCVVKGGLCQ